MKFNPIPLLTSCLLIGFFSSAQVRPDPLADDQRYRLQLINGAFVPEKNITPTRVGDLNRKAVRINNRSFVIIQFEILPDAGQRKQLQDQGIELLDYIPHNAFAAIVKDSLSFGMLTRMKARAVVELSPQQKMHPALAKGIFPSRAVKQAGTVDVAVSYYRAFSFETVSSGLKAKNFDIVSTDWRNYNIVGLRVSTSRLNELAGLPFVSYISVEKEDQPLNNKSVATTRANVLHSSLPGGRNLRGEGVVIGVGDDADPLNHIDFNGRLINRHGEPFQQHGLHVTGTVGGGGLIKEKFMGLAPKSTLISQLMSGILVNAPAYVQDYGMVITNNSYANTAGDDCALLGMYDVYSRAMDIQAFQMPNLLHVFSSGNWGQVLTCPPELAGFSNIYEGFQTAKNVITVGNTFETELIHPSSAKGPTRDGRIKPEICAQGTRVWSTYAVNTYSFLSGTSMSSPAVAGGLGLLYQRYKQLNAGVNPKNGLMKALLCNGGRDLGNAGPDYSYGFGIMNLLRSVTMLEKNNYINDSVNVSAFKNHTITIPAGSSIAQLKVMLYWNDPAAAALASHSLVNDLDLEVTDPGSVVHLPYILDTIPALVTNPATTGVDHINNIEQVVINNPAAGTYTFTVRGTTIPFAPRHEYFLVYDTIPVSTVLTYPMGGEKFRGGDSVYINWESYGNPSNDFTVQFRLFDVDGWTTINPSPVAADKRQQLWFIAAGVATDQARVKVIHNGTGIESISEPFTIIGSPSLVGTQCEGYITLNWGAITGATDYEVMMLRGEEMTPVATTAGTTYTFNGLSRDSVYWVTVRSRINGNPGRRDTAIGLQPNGATCGGSISDNDVMMQAIVSPASSGRLLTSTALTNSIAVTIRIKNLDNTATTGNIPVAYKLGTNPQVNETIIAPNIAAGATYDHTFAVPIDLSAAGSYSLRVSVSYTADVVNNNDTLTRIFKQLNNAFIDLTSVDFLDDIESAPVQEHMTAQVGLTGLDRYDFVTTSALGRIRTFVNTGIAFSGSKALTMDSERYNGGGTADSLKATFNLNGYNVNTDDIRFDFRYKHHIQLPNAANRVWIRGSDLQPWIQVYDLYANQDDPGVFVKTPSLEISDILAANSQVFTSSFQVRWGQWGQKLTADNLGSAGYTFDDIHLYLVTDDIQMVSIDEPVIASCGLTNATPVRVTVRNSSNATITNIPVTFQANTDPPVTEFIASLAGNTSVSYLFTGTADFSAIGPHTLVVYSDLASDTYNDNDTARLTLNNSPVITTFPYLENFESNDGFWYSAGKKNSWQYGTPASTKINRAASGIKAWKTTLAGNYNDLELSYLYSPCFDVTGMTIPTLSLSIALDIEDCGAGSLCDAAYVEYSSDGITWTKLGTTGAGTNWYNRNYAGHHVWSRQNYTRWHVATIPLPTGISKLRLRFAMETDPYVSYEGIAVDDIHIYDNLYGIYTGPPFTSTIVNQPAVNGSAWVDFVNGGKLIASVNPNGQNLGSTDVQAYIHTGAVRVNSQQYYHNRNITIKPATVNLADSATVRFYFLDTETEALINATGCGGCSKPTTAYQLGVTKYSDAVNVNENGTLADNLTGDWLFINSAKAVKVPFDRGYYAEFKVKDFSEFWLNNGGPNNQSLPAELVSFTATKKSNKDVLTEWIIASENNTARYEVEVSRGNEEYRQNRFAKIGEVASNGNATTEQRYQFTDQENNKSGVRYYRLKMVDQDGRYTYSLIKPVVFNEEIKWQVYPNPSSGVFGLAYQVTAGETVGMKVYDVNGKQVQYSRVAASGFVQKHEINLSGKQFVPGVYLLEVTVGTEKRVFRLLKQ
jgi:hypothetical protein